MPPSHLQPPSNFQAARPIVTVSLSSPVQSFGSAAGGSAVVLLVLGRLGPEIVSLFDGVEGVVDGGAVGPAPGPRRRVVQHPPDGLHREAVLEQEQRRSITTTKTLILFQAMHSI